MGVSFIIDDDDDDDGFDKYNTRPFRGWWRARM